MTPLLALHDVSVAFGGLKALTGVSFDVREHEIVAVIGPNGAGKSTLLNAISGIAPRSSGELLLAGVPIASRPAAVARQGLARSFQHPQLLLEESVRENLLCGLFSYESHPILARFIPRLSPAPALTADVAAVAQIFGLNGMIEERTGHLSYGTQKIVDIARAFVGQPRMILLDEPSSGLDRAETGRLGEMIAAASARRRVTILLVEHDMELVRQLAHRVVALEAGAVVAQGKVAEVLDSLGLARMLMGNPIDGDTGASTPTGEPACKP